MCRRAAENVSGRTKRDEDEAKDTRECEGPPWLSRAAKWREHRHEIVICYCLQQAWRARERLQAGAKRGEDDAYADDPVGGPCHGCWEGFRVEVEGVTTDGRAPEKGGAEVEQ